MIDIRQALKVKAMDPKRDYKIGRLTSNFPGTMGGAKAGDIILFRSEEDGKTCTIDEPMSDEWLAQQKAKGSGLTTIGTCVGVPLRYIEEILL